MFFSIISTDIYQYLDSPIVLCFILMALCLVYNGWRASYWHRNGIPGPSTLPLVGNALDILFKPSFESELEYVKRYGKVVGIYHGVQPNLIVADPDLIRCITVKEFATFPASFKQIYVSPVEDKFLTVLYGEEWKRVRSLLTPTFTSGKLRKIFRLINGCMAECLDNCSRSIELASTNQRQIPINCTNPSSYFKCVPSSEGLSSYLSEPAADTRVNRAQYCVDMKRFWGSYNMDVTSKCFFGTNLGVYSTETDEQSKSTTSERLKHFEKLFITNSFAALVTLISPEWFTKITRTSSLFSEEALTYLNTLARAVIASRKEQINAGSIDKRHNDFLQLLIEAETNGTDGQTTGESTKAAETSTSNVNENTKDNNSNSRQKLSLDEIVSSAVIFMIAGYETTSTLLSWTCYELAKHAEIQETLYAEISSLSEINYETINSCEYLEAVINESLRIHPPVISLPRIAQFNYNIPSTKAVLPAGSKAFISIWSVHHNPEYWPEPSTFKPERFLPENRSQIKPFTFIPFGSGPRTCIGQRFAQINVKLALAVFIKRFKLLNNSHTTQKIDYEFNSGVLTAKKIEVAVEER